MLRCRWRKNKHLQYIMNFEVIVAETFCLMFHI